MMLIGEVILAIVMYPVILLVPGILWTFLFKSISSKLGIIKRIIFSGLISIISITLILFSVNQFFGVQINYLSVASAILFVLLFPLLISVLLPKPDIQKLNVIIKELKLHIVFTYQELRKVLSTNHNLILIGILAIGICLAVFPHLGYGLPIHTDEWHYMAYADNLISSENITLENPYYGGAATHWELGFIIFISFIKLASGVSWPTLFSTLPAFIFSLTILTSYLIGKKNGYGLHAAFLVVLIPSTLRLLGPIFLVPVSLGILLILISIFLLIAHKNFLKYPVAFLSLTAAFIIHPPSGGYLFIVFFAFFINSIFRKEKHDSIYMGAILGIFTLGIFLLPHSYFHGLSFSQIFSSSDAFLPLFGFMDFIEQVNYIPVLLAAIGIVFLLQQKERYSQSLIAIFILLFIFIISLYYVFPEFYQIQAVYDRAILLMIFVLGLIAGAGLLVVQKNVKKPLFAILVVCLLALSIHSHINEPYYNIINENEYDDFVWIHDNLNSTYDKAILDPWQAVAFTPVTGKQVYYRTPQGPDGMLDTMSERISEFFSDGCVDTAFLESNGITIVYTHGICNNPDLQEVRSGVYVLNYTG